MDAHNKMLSKEILKISYKTLEHEYELKQKLQLH